MQQFSEQIRKYFPSCPDRREQEIAEHACMKYSGRIGRTADAKIFNENSITLAVIAHIRHTETSYDELLSNNYEKQHAREIIKDKVDQVLNSWRIT